MSKKRPNQMFIPAIVARPKGMPPNDVIRSECVRSSLTPADADKLIDFWLGNGFKTGKNGVKDWKAVIRTWKTNKWFPSQKNSKDQSDQDKARMSAEMAELRKIHSSDANRRLL